jgi:hypothetical protein
MDERREANDTGKSAEAHSTSEDTEAHSTSEDTEAGAPSVSSMEGSVRRSSRGLKPMVMVDGTMAPRVVKG